MNTTLALTLFFIGYVMTVYGLPLLLCLSINWFFNDHHGWKEFFLPRGGLVDNDPVTVRVMYYTPVLNILTAAVLVLIALPMTMMMLAISVMTCLNNIKDKRNGYERDIDQQKGEDQVLEDHGDN